MKLSDLTRVDEGLSPILYHITGLHDIASILEENRFALTTTVGTGSEQISDHWYFLSTSRTPHNRYFNGRSRSGYFVLDGRKLGTRYKGKPFDYWHTPAGLFNGQTEAEDRIFSHDAFIPNAANYIIEIHVFSNLPKVQADVYADNLKEQIVKIRDTAAQLGIPVFYYNDAKNFLLHNKARAVPLDDQLLVHAPPEPRYQSDRVPFERWMELYQKTSMAELSKWARQTSYNLDPASFYGKGSLDSLQADIHNNKNRGKAEPILTVFRQLKVKSARDFLIKMDEKWRAIHRREHPENYSHESS